MRKVKEVHEALTRLHHKVGVPPRTITDGHCSLAKGEFSRKSRRAGSRLKTTEAYTPRQNLAEAGVRELKRMHKKSSIATGSPLYVWNHSLELQAAIRSNTVYDVYDLNGKVPKTVKTGDTSDILNLAEFGW